MKILFFRISSRSYVINFKRKFLPGQGFELAPVIRPDGIVGSAPARTAEDPGSNPGPGENFSLKINSI